MAAPLAGEYVRTSHYPKVRVVRKAATETVTNSATLQNDDDFSITLEADKSYRIELHLVASGPAAADVRLAWTATGGASSPTGRHVLGPESGTASVTATQMRATATHAFTTNVIYGTDGTSNSRIYEDFLVDVVGSSGTLTLQWAQGTANATGTNVFANSYLVVTEVDDF